MDGKVIFPPRTLALDVNTAERYPLLSPQSCLSLFQVCGGEMRRNYATRQCMNTYYGKTLHAQLETWESDTYQTLKSLKREAETAWAYSFSHSNLWRTCENWASKISAKLSNYARTLIERVRISFRGMGVKTWRMSAQHTVFFLCTWLFEKEENVAIGFTKLKQQDKVWNYAYMLGVGFSVLRKCCHKTRQSFLPPFLF